MKIAVCAQSDTPNAAIDARFGRAAFFAVFDDAARQWAFFENNQNLQAAQGAGIQAAQTVIDANADALIAFNVGPKAMAALTASGIAVYQTITGVTVQQALNEYQDGTLTQLQQPNVEGHWV